VPQCTSKIPYSPTRNTVLSRKATIRPHPDEGDARDQGFSQRYRLERRASVSKEYRTLRQKRLPRPVPSNTVLSDKEYRTLRQKIPYPPTNLPLLLGPVYPAPRTILTKVLQKRRLSRVRAPEGQYRTLRQGIPYSPTRNTVLSDKEYRTLRQGIPYSPTRNTVLSDKEYRTVQQNIAYPPTNSVRDVPAKGGKNVGGRFVRPVCVYCLMFLCCLGNGDKGIG
jgi:hypothetical protein